VKGTGLPKYVSTGEGGVPTEVDFTHGGEPAEREAVRHGVQEGGFREVYFAGNALHPVIAAWGVEEAYRCGVAAKWD
jgi:hypothetical protein